jgi:hypothetical protein
MAILLSLTPGLSPVVVVETDISRFNGLSRRDEAAEAAGSVSSSGTGLKPGVNGICEIRALTLQRFNEI